MRPFEITLRRHFHIGHVEPLTALRDHEHVYRVRVGEAFKPNAERLLSQNRLAVCPSSKTREAAAKASFCIPRPEPQDT